MTNQATKFALGLAALSAFAAFVAPANVDRAAALLLLAAALGAGAVALGFGRSVGADITPPTEAGVSTPVDATDMPAASYGPIVTAVGAFLLAAGGALGSDYVVAAIVVGIVGATIWTFDSFKAAVDAKSVENVDNRFLGPIALPVGGFLLTLAIAVAFSRVLLAVNETASWVTAFVVAAVVLAILWIVAERGPSTKAVGGLTALGVVAVLVAGVGGAGAGTRDFHHHEHENPIVNVVAKDTQYDRKIIALPPETEVEIVFENRDIDVFHNIGIYTEGEPGEPIYNSKPIAKGTEVSKFETPEAGTYVYVCDFHPTMIGELRVEEGAETSHESETEEHSDTGSSEEEETH